MALGLLAVLAATAFCHLPLGQSDRRLVPVAGEIKIGDHAKPSYWLTECCKGEKALAGVVVKLAVVDGHTIATLSWEAWDPVIESNVSPRHGVLVRQGEWDVRLLQKVDVAEK